MVIPPKNLDEMEALERVVEALRGPDGCPWDREQTHRSLLPFAVEEVYEFLEAIESGDAEHVVEELGDLLLQVVLHAQIAKESGSFTLSTVVQRLNEKMIRRHPHVFSDGVAQNSKEVLAQWSKIKDQETKGEADLEKTKKRSLGGPKSLPSLQRAQKIGEKTHQLKFDWSNAREVFAKVEEEVSELKATLVDLDQELQRAELGDVLFTVVQLGRHLGIDAEGALREANERFEGRFHQMNQLADQENVSFSELALEEKEKLWQRAKELERTTK